MTGIFIIIGLLIILVAFCLYVRNHRIKDIYVKLSFLKGFEFSCSFYKN
nr:MAG TPA: cytokine receptor common subunit [Caudoviricetes sp.]